MIFRLILLPGRLFKRPFCFLFIVSILVSAPRTFGQQQIPQHPFNIWQVELDLVYDAEIHPHYLEFSSDEKFLYILQKVDASFRLEKLDLIQKRIVASAILPFTQIATCKVSPSQNDLIFTNSIGELYYLPGIWTGNKEVYKIPFLGGGAVWISNELIGNTGVEESTIVEIFSIEKWRSRYIQQWEIENGNGWRSNFGQLIKIEPKEYRWTIKEPFKKEGSRLFVQSVIDKDAEQYYFNIDHGAQLISKNQSYLAFSRKSKFFVNKTVINPRYKRDTICFTLNNYFLIPKNEKEKLEKLLSRKEYIQVNVVGPRFHPVTKQVLGAGGSVKAVFRIFDGIDSVLFGVLINKTNFSNVIEEGDFVGGIESDAKLANNDLGELSLSKIYRWNLDAKVSKACHYFPIAAYKAISAAVTEEKASTGKNTFETYTISKNERTLCLDEPDIAVKDVIKKESFIANKIKDILQNDLKFKANNTFDCNEKYKLIVNLDLSYSNLEDNPTTPNYITYGGISLKIIDSRSTKTIFTKVKAIKNFNILGVISQSRFSTREQSLQNFMENKFKNFLIESIKAALKL
jgi:hypothetical protein